MPLFDALRTVQSQHHLFSPGDIVVVGVSGGPDSLTLLHALQQLSDEFDITLHVAHLNHMLRGSEGDADAEFVAHRAQTWEVPVTVGARDVAALAREQHLSLEEAARHARYEFLAEVAEATGARVIAVAHNADDQIETVLMHLLRGSGLAGLRGMGYVSTSGGRRLVRPLLDVTRAEIEEYCRENGLSPRLDRSNLDTTFFRNRLRHEALPYLETLNPNLRQVWRRMSQTIADDYDFLQTRTQETYARIVREEQGSLVFDREAWRALVPAPQRGTLRMAVQALRSHLRDINWTPVEDARRVALDRGVGAQATLPDGLVLTVGYSEFVISEVGRALPIPDVPLLNVASIELRPPGVAALPGSDWRVATAISDHPQAWEGRWTAQFDLDRCAVPFILRPRQPGDRFQPAGLRGHSKSLHEFMIDEKVPQVLRDRLPILTAGGQIIWVCGRRVDERARPTAATTRFLQVTFRHERES